VAKQLRAGLEKEGAETFVKTSGKTRLHVLVRWQGDGGHDEARAWAKEVADRVAALRPELTTTEIRKAKRGRRVYLDTLQNAAGKHAVPPYVLRAVPGAPVSTPLTWSELKANLTPGQFTLKTIFRRLARQRRDPLADLAEAVGVS
jgi:bifunctional non-homologous end joining protein LigD